MGKFETGAGFTGDSDRPFKAPPSPHTVAETGLDPRLLLNLTMKIMYLEGVDTIAKLSGVLKLGGGVIEEILEEARILNLVEPLGSSSAALNAEMRYGLMNKGREWALEALAQNQYAGAAPVTLEQLSAQIRAQSISHENITRPTLEHAFSKLVVAEEMLGRLGPAVNSARSMLLYGPPGNGKSSIATALMKAYKHHVYIPFAVEVAGQIISIYDGAVHRPVNPAEVEDTTASPLRLVRKNDARWVECLRPVVMVGGELSLEMLDLIHNPVAKFYEAPLQLKAMNGLFIIDDFGRQDHEPQALVNRWIVPLEMGVDFLRLQSGRKFDVPFDCLLTFSTNIPPKSLIDGAGLRRIYHKIEITYPPREDWEKVFHAMAKHLNLEVEPGLLDWIVDELYTPSGENFSNFHPKFMLEQNLAMCGYHDVERKIHKEFLKVAWQNLFTSE